ncbi:alpha/beta hydrolase [Stenotrophomonas sp. 24(2023)]|uniref:alpha/beta fold hydrolase n=1 Tax=Stenotrophomonas sp. 24(2023) TaxID=3068324 RepID=UPI0027DFF54B|nr:alpha/beta hydrolase [Stenotrophomonas sp. 24(2023)]WMJ69752.1 alpha/beta hydrolase [Stenotrophomonas sp. 24(2023)]
MKQLRVYAMALVALASFGACAQGPDRLAAGEHVAELQGLTLHYTIAGHGPLLVVQSPGWGIGTPYLANGLKPLQDQFTVLTYDPRGTGGSTPVAADAHLTNGDLADDLEQLRAYLGLERMDLLGHSNGGAIAIIYAEQHPAHVHKLVLVGAQLLGYRQEADSVAKAESARRKASPDFAWLREHIGDPTPRTDAAFTAYFRERAGYFLYDPKKDADVFLGHLTNTMSASMNQAFEETPPVKAAPPLSDLGRITAATLVVEGRQDPACPLAMSEAIQHGIAGAQLVALDRTGHFPWIEQPAPFFAAVSRFLRQ